MSKNSEYWRQRFVALEDNNYATSQKYYKDLQEQFRIATNDMQMDIEKWYRRLADNNDISYAASKKMLKTNELEEFHWTVEQYIKKGEENAVNQAWMKQLENASARVHISRLESMKLSIQQHAELLYTQYNNGVTDFLNKTFTDNFYHSAYEIAKGTGIGTNLNKLDVNKINTIITKPWAADGANFSDRIWTNKNKLVYSLHTELSQSIIRGEDTENAINNLAKKMNVGKSQAANLIMTESAAISALGQKQCFNDLDVEEFEVVETLDITTCSMCKEMDGNHYPMSDFLVGLTAPPFHPRCRGCTCPYFNDEFTVGEQRAARGEDGKTYYVPADINYNQWFKEYVEKDKEHVKIELTDLEQGALNKYLSFDSYLINESLRNSTPLTTIQQDIVSGLDAALSKIPTYNGNLSRSLEFKTEDAVNEYLKRFMIDGDVIFKEYISTTSSEQGYNMDGQVQIFIQNTKRGHDLNLYNSNEEEVLYNRGSNFKVLNMAKKGDKHYILLEEL